MDRRAFIAGGLASIAAPAGAGSPPLDCGGDVGIIYDVATRIVRSVIIPGDPKFLPLQVLDPGQCMLCITMANYLALQTPDGIDNQILFGFLPACP